MISEARKGNPIWEISTETELSAFIRETGIVLTSSILEEYFQLENDAYQEKKSFVIDLHKECVKSDTFMGSTFDLRHGKFLVRPY